MENIIFTHNVCYASCSQLQYQHNVIRSVYSNNPQYFISKIPC